jgi:hypothetical protein
VITSVSALLSSDQTRDRGPGMVLHAYHPIYLGGGSRKVSVQGQPQKSQHEALPEHERTDDVTQVVWCLVGPEFNAGKQTRDRYKNTREEASIPSLLPE